MCVNKCMYVCMYISLLKVHCTKVIILFFENAKFC